MSPRLNQVIAVEKGAKSQTEGEITNAYHLIQKTDLFNGLSRVYTPKDDEDEQLPGESTNVIATVPALIEAITKAMVKLFDVTATKVYANTAAMSDITVDGTVLLSDVPVEYLLFLEKRLVDIQTFLSKLPTLDPAFTWRWDDAAGAYRTEPVRTNRTKKVPKNHVKAPATDKHPAQVEVFYEDDIVGYWDKTMFSGAVPVTQVREWQERAAKLQAAVKYAREEANGAEAVPQEVGAKVFQYLFSGNGRG